jgi:hypothetical protein
MHRWRVTGTVLGLLLCLLSAAAGAAAPREAEPTLAPLTSVRMQSIFYTDLDGPILVCQRRIESWQRWHDTCRSLAASPYYPNYETGDVVENVLYDGLFYSRRNAETTWAVTSAEAAHDPALTLTAGLFGIPFEAAVTDLGSLTIGGTPTTHYQYWSIDKAYNQSLGDVQPVYDHFVAADGLVIQDQASLRGSNTLTRVRGYTQHNTPIAVAAPPANLVEADKQAIINPR